MAIDWGPTRVCTKCGEEKPLFLFHKNKPSKDGRLRKCAECFNEEINAKNVQRTAEKSFDDLIGMRDRRRFTP